ncbi:MAG: 2-amino-4-hydroxy-6-hydroxymethyldihydropteridine diphosphokinase [Candidatus Liberibacter europaeus]|uniref:2-amino-4-hydroxy-6-hydroxymethyldihydropteridine pyrophosphokinase n=1 Tax=Candidatus Liberibacter europaeus TaxID=744859 RepID=A0A2T4VX30_9HYPH|nr:2-amino-4-hydroxy-6-hydroxymethyldihydropteridine diphosphokinase [Candidatus Liberibacter europaeus]PTL86330.1 MAG: 2-amino-4-hydroxy-6-hydroxymethyldihydropteridine diphosphokinase [Candidatus Liberibacter europaeus]
MWKSESNTLIKHNYDPIAIGIGSNVGNKQYYLSQSLRLIHNHRDCEVISVSRLYNTSPWGKTDQEFFLNAVALIKTKVLPNELLDILLSIENKLKRERGELWGPRTIDLDILLFGNYACSTNRLTIPHPYITQRAFVIVPLADVAPHILINGLSISYWIGRIDVSEVQIIRNDCNWWIDCDGCVDILD